VDIRFVDVHRVAAYLSKYLTGDKVEHTLWLLPRRARIYTTARCIVLWPKKEKSGWRLRRADIGELLDTAENPSNVKFVAVEDLKAFGLELLSYFESPPCAGDNAFAGEATLCATLRRDKATEFCSRAVW
jgi:hypothetical protein